MQNTMSSLFLRIIHYGIYDEGQLGEESIKCKELMYYLTCFYVEKSLMLMVSGIYISCSCSVFLHLLSGPANDFFEVIFWFVE